MTAPSELQQAVADGMRLHLADALVRLRAAGDELELAHEHNRTLLALLDRARRDGASVRAELLQVRGILGEELR